jgi:Fur family peroxide stress response transcriptional regulator
MDPIMPELIARVSDEANFTIIGSSLDLKGICDSCEKRSERLVKGESQASRAEASQ